MADSHCDSNPDSEAQIGSLILSHIKRHLESCHGGDEKHKKAKQCSEDDYVPSRVHKVQFKIFADPIHGTIQLHPVCVAIIDTPEFQRLRDIKQLGLCYYVYPGAAHNRFEHSLGVSYLAGEFVRILKEKQPELHITDKDILCLEIAGLCHDLGHGPYSHAFDGKFVPLCEDISEKVRDHWEHEKASVQLFQYIFDTYGTIRNIFKEYNLDATDRQFIKELIMGPTDIKEKEAPLSTHSGHLPSTSQSHQSQSMPVQCTSSVAHSGDSERWQTWPNEGRGKNKSFLYEIVANKRTSIDVDKWDYIARDCHQLGIKNNFDHIRFMKFTRVIKGRDSKLQICLRDKELVNLYNLFSTRYLLHKNAYQHKVICALDIMVSQALVKANKDLLIDGYKMSDIIETGNWKAYSLLTDSILYKIRDATSDSKNMKEAKKIVERIFSRDFYKCVYESKPGKWTGEKSGENKRETYTRLRKEILTDVFDKTGIVEDEFFVQMVKLDFGFKRENPIKKIGAYSKNEPDKVTNISENQLSTILEHYTFEEHILRIYVSSKGNEDIVKEARDKLDRWSNKNLPVQAKVSNPGTSEVSGSTS